MSSPKSKTAISRLGKDLRAARLRRRMPAADLAVRAGVSLSTVARLEKGDPGVAIGTLADVLVAMGLIKRLSDLVDIRTDDLGLALAVEQTPQRASGARSRRTKSSKLSKGPGRVDPDGAEF
jgi:transcriptional regulator with XRE-family HTH domain